MKKSNMFRIVSGALLVALTLFSFVQQPVNAQAVQVTVCHAAGPSNYVTIYVSISSVDDANGLNGHGNHGGDAWGSFVFDGVTYPGQGDFSNCTSTEPDPVDVCPNLDGDQATIPDGYELNDEDECVLIEEDPTDVCPNIDGIQETIPDGYELDGQLQCVPTEDEPDPTDVCPNLDGLQETIPDGYELDGQQLCVPIEEPEDPGDPEDPPVISTVPLLIPVTGVESMDSGQLLLSLSGLGAGLTLLIKGLFGKDK